MQKSVIADGVSKMYEISKSKKETQFREAIVNFAKRKLFHRDEKKERIWALKNVSFSLDSGETVGIIGNNGAGKSTILKILSKITYPSSGKIKTNGRVASLLEVGTGFHEELSGRENVYLNGSILGMKKREVKAKMDQIVAFAEVEKFLDTPIKRYSSGMRMRLGFSVAAHLDTDILFIDEVLSVGDAAFQKKCLGTMGDMRTSGKTVIFVSHNMPTVENLCPRVIWIDKGEIQADGKGSAVIEKYLSRGEDSAAQFLSKYDFRSLNEHEGSGEITYVGFEILDRDGQPKNIIRSGDFMKFRLHYQAHQLVVNPRFQLSINTEKGARIATFGSDISGHYVEKLPPGEGYIDVDVESMNIMPDRYFFNFWIFGDRRNSYYERIWACAWMDVEYSNFYKTGKGIDKELGHVFMPCRWDMNGIGKSFIEVF